MSSEIKYSKELDAVGMYCPMPLSLTNESIVQVEIGQVLKVVADDPAAEEDLKAWAKRKGHEILSLTKDGSILTFYIKRIK